MPVWTLRYWWYCRCMKFSNGLPEQYLSTLPPSSLAHDIPYDRMLLVCMRGGARSAEALLSKNKLFALADNLGGLESCGIPCADDTCEYPACRT
ncbi:hypothetical protein P692DRAFT_20920626 [Suillus brevipes Sb2]|nr:hypothetical protein P692DRAFT_20920626 [Suillus brevipes Sb2]